MLFRSTSNLTLVEGTTYIANGNSVALSILTLPTPSATNKVIMIHGWEAYTLNNGNNATAAMNADTLAICVSTGSNDGNWTVKTSTITYGGPVSFS